MSYIKKLPQKELEKLENLIRFVRVHPYNYNSYQLESLISKFINHRNGDQLPIYEMNMIQELFQLLDEIEELEKQN